MDDALKQLFAAIETYSTEQFATILETNFKLINCLSTTVRFLDRHLSDVKY